jgi:hypothetical protein
MVRIVESEYCEYTKLMCEAAWNALLRLVIYDTGGLPIEAGAVRRTLSAFR